MAYRRFKIPGEDSTAATVATVATISSAEARNVASVAITVPQEVMSGVRRSVASVATVAGPTRENATFPEDGEWAPEDWLSYFDERAAVAEFDNGLSRQKAEAAAYESCVLEWLDRHFTVQALDPCPAGSEAEDGGNTSLPTGKDETGIYAEHYRHRSLMAAALLDQAMAALSMLGIEAPVEVQRAELETAVRLGLSRYRYSG
jgi:hypothetical protein